jgi:hypothetical protein
MRFCVIREATPQIVMPWMRTALFLIMTVTATAALGGISVPSPFTAAHPTLFRVSKLSQQFPLIASEPIQSTG